MHFFQVNMKYSERDNLRREKIMEGTRYIWCHQNIYGLIILRSVRWKDLNDTSTGKNKIIYTNVKVS